MKKNLLTLLLLSFIALSSAFAQSRTISGKVTGSDDGQPLPGVSVKIAGTSTGTQTNPQGEYTITVPSSAKLLVFTYIGYSAQTASISGTTLNIILKSDAKALGEVVVVGYGTQNRKELTGAVSSVKGSAVTDVPVASFDQALSGKVAGAQVTQSSGILGQAPRIRIRGTNSINGGADPLYVLDGIVLITGSQSGIISTNPLGDINPEDIQSIDVLKDGAATAIYGSRGSNGVIIITTKRGTVGAPKISYDSWYASSKPAKRFDVLNAADFITIANEKLASVATAANIANGSYKKAFPTLDPNGVPYDTNWQDVVFDNKAFQQNQSLSVSGATPSTNYFFSLGYTDLSGIIVGNKQTKYQFRAKVETKALNDHLTFGINTSTSYVDNLGLNISTTGLSSNVSDAIRSFPNVPVFNANGTYNLSADNIRLGGGANTRNIDDNYTNIKYILDHNVYRNQNLTMNDDAYIGVNIIKGLDFKTQLGINALYGEDYEYLDPLHGDGGSSTKGYEFQQYIPSFRYDWVNTLTYNKVIGNNSFNAVGGFEIQKSRYRSFNASGSNISGTFFGGQNIISNTLTQSTFGIGGGVGEQAYKSWFGRVNYAFKEKYLLSATYRADAISSLPVGNQYAYLPGGSVAWRISKEPFFADSKALSFINDLKIRGGYAKTGNTDIGNYPYAGTFGAAIYGSQSGIAYSQVGNPVLKFETTDKIDGGVDIAFLNDRITLSADYYRNNDNNLILAVPIPPSLGAPGNSINENAGNMYNTGYEFAISSVNIRKAGFTWTTDLNLTFTKNKITALSNNNSDQTFSYNINRVGYSIGSIYGYNYQGVNPANGNPLYLKGNGQLVQGNANNSTYYNYDPNNQGAALVAANATTLSSTTDRFVLGNSNPTYFGGFNNSFAYKGIDVGIFFTFSGGNKVMNVTSQESLFNQKFQNGGTGLLSRWTTPGQVTNVPRLYFASDAFTNLMGSASSRFVEDGKFIRAQDITLGYSLPKQVLSKMKLTKLRVFAQIQNAFVLTKYTGLDPELNTNGSTNSQAGLDYNTNPRARSFTLGLNVGL